MYAMQYDITLPADYDMNIIRQRVATRGHLLDNFPGLGLKAYLIRERGIDGSLVNQYAPFYLWSSITGMNQFLWGVNAGFAGIVNSFGRPAVKHWTGVAAELGTEQTALPCMATRHTEIIAENVDLTLVVKQALEELKQRAGMPGVHSTALAIDPRHWELVHFTLWNNMTPEATGTRYQVLYLSMPHPIS
jgi:hypothetical protein